MTPPAVVIFDLDDTLIDTRVAVGAARRAVAEAFVPGLNAASHSEILAEWQRVTWFFRPEDHVMAIDMLRRERDLPHLAAPQAEELEHMFRVVLMEHLRPAQGAYELLGWLSSIGLRSAIVSNGSVGFQMEKIRHTGLAEWFDDGLIHICEPMGREGKPYPTPFLVVCSRFGVQPSRALVVGDRISDVIGGNLAGCTTVLVMVENLDVKTPSPAGRLAVEVPAHSIRRLLDLREFC